MKKILFSALLLVGGMTVYAQDSKNLVYDEKAEVRKVGDFKGIEISNAIALYLSQGRETAVAISAENESSRVKTEVKNGILKIYLEGNFWKWHNDDKRVKAYVTVRDIEKISASGASMIRITDKITSHNLKIVMTGASNLKGDIKAESLHIELSGASSSNASLNCGELQVGISGASTGNFSGSANHLDIDVSGASNLKAYDLETNTCSAEASGASSIKVNVVKEFTKIEASGASSIRYKGNATVRNFESSGASSIKKESR